MFLILKDSVIYLIAIGGSRLLFFIYKIIIARMLGPRDYGLWNMLALILIYGGFLHLGLCFALVKEVSFYRGKEKWSEIIEIRNTVFTSIMIFSTIAGIIIFILSIFLNKSENCLFVVFCIIAFVLILQQMKNYFLYYFIAEKNFKAVSALILSSVFLIGSITVILVTNLGFIGLPLGMTLGNLLVLFYIFYKYKPAFQFQLNIKRFFSLIKIGFPIMLVVIAYTLFLTIDRVLIFKYLGKENLGYYSIVFALSGLLILFPMSIGVIIFPRLSEKYGAAGETKGLKEFIYTPTVMLAYFMAALSGLIYLFLPSAVKIIVPQYIPGINAGRIALAGAMFLSASVLAQKFLIVINRQTQTLFIALSAIALKLVLIYIFINRHMGINGVALAGNIIYFGYSIFIIIFAFYYCKVSPLESMKYLIKIYLPFIYLLLIFVIFNYFKQASILNTGNEIMYISITCILFTIFVVMPFGYFINKNLRIYLNLNIFQDKK